MHSLEWLLYDALQASCSRRPKTLSGKQRHGNMGAVFSSPLTNGKLELGDCVQTIAQRANNSSPALDHKVRHIEFHCEDFQSITCFAILW